jgi:hypothetical protein
MFQPLPDALRQALPGNELILVTEDRLQGTPVLAHSGIDESKGIGQNVSLQPRLKRLCPLPV